MNIERKILIIDDEVDICQQISGLLNDRGFRTPTNKEWNKSLLSLHIKKMNVDVGK